jgi:hypothetical protein
MASKQNHRLAFGNDPKFLERLAKQGVSIGGDQSAAQPRGISVAGLEQPVPEKKVSSGSRRLAKVKEANKESRNDRLIYDAATNTLAAVFPGAMLLGLNMMLRMHDAEATGLKKTWTKRIEALMYEGKQAYDEWRVAAVFPVIIDEVYLTGESVLLDNESVCASCKPIIDAFVTNGFLPDDSPTYVAHPIPYTERAKSPAVIIRFRSAIRPWGLIDDVTIQLAREMTP